MVSPEEPPSLLTLSPEGFHKMVRTPPVIVRYLAETKYSVPVYLISTD